MNKSICFIVAATMIYGCAITGNNFATEKVSTVRLGKSTRSEIEKMFGKSTTAQKIIVKDLASDIEILDFTDRSYSVKGRYNSKYLIIEYMHGIVNGYIFNNSFQDYHSTDFSTQKAAQLTVHKDTKEDVVAALGAEYGEITLPSHLPSRMYDESALKIITSDAASLLIYQYTYYTESDLRYRSVTKSLLLPFDSTGTLLDKYYFESSLR